MKLLDSPRTGRLGSHIFYPSPFGQCCRALTVPHDPKTPAQSRARAIFGSCSNAWGRTLTEAQRLRWVSAAQTAPSHPSLGQYYHLSGQQFYVQINSTLHCIGQPPAAEPPAPVLFSPNPVAGLEIDNDAESGVRLLLNVGTVSEDIMVFGQPPCSAGRMKHRRVYYLGLLGPATGGQCDITALYTARFGQPVPGQKVFIVTIQTKNGWKGQEWSHNAIVPPPPEPGSQQPTGKTRVVKSKAPTAPESASAPAKVISPLRRDVYKGSTRDARQEHEGLKREHPASIPGTPLVHGLLGALRGLVRLGMAGASACMLTSME